MSIGLQSLSFISLNGEKRKDSAAGLIFPELPVREAGMLYCVPFAYCVCSLGRVIAWTPALASIGLSCSSALRFLGFVLASRRGSKPCLPVCKIPPLTHMLDPRLSLERQLVSCWGDAAAESCSVHLTSSFSSLFRPLITGQYQRPALGCILGSAGMELIFTTSWLG